MKKKLFALLFASILSIIAYAHEFWLEPHKFLLSQGERIKLSIFVGENFKGEETDFTKFKVNKFAQYKKSGVRNISGDLNEAVANEFLKFDEEGNHLIVFNNSNKFIGLEASKFNEYLHEDGLDNILALRKQQNKLNKDGKEYYQRCVKTLLKVGNSQDDTYKINSGMPLELIPSQNPYENISMDSLSFLVLYSNIPLKNALVVAWQKGVGESTTIQKTRTDKNGKANFKFEKKGTWMISTVKMIEINSPKADYQSYWGSYTFGYQ